MRDNIGLFRGKRKDTLEWVEGYYVHIPCGRLSRDEHLIQTVKDNGQIGQLYEVIPETVGEYTGLTDKNGKNGKKIFEGDILHLKAGDGWTCPKGTDVYYKVVFTEFNEEWNSTTEYIGFMAENEYGSLSSIDYHIREHGATVIGNIHDNSELLKGGVE